jgi:transcriptional regulator with XRE-family HTH domain
MVVGIEKDTYLCKEQQQSNMAKHEIKTLPGENLVGEFFARFPELNVRQIALAMGINETLMQQYVNGKKRPSFERILELEDFIHTLGRELSQANIIPKQ